MTKIHPTAIIDPSVKLAAGVTIGPWCVIGPDCESFTAPLSNVARGPRD